MTAPGAAKVQVAVTPDRPGSPRGVGGDRSPSPGPPAQFAQAVGEGLWELQAVLDEPGCFGDMSLGDAAASLASQFVGPQRDEEVTRRLAAVVEAEAGGNLRLAARHLGHVRRKLAERGIVPVRSAPLDPSAR